MQLFTSEQVERFYELDWWTHDTFDALVDRHIAARPDQDALVDPPNRATFTDGSPRRWTWSEIAQARDGLATAFLDAGIGAGDVVGIQLPNIAELGIVYLALFRIGAIASPFPAQYREHEIADFGAIGGFSALLTTNRIGERANAAAFVALQEKLPTVKHVFAFGSDLPAGTIGIDGALAGPSDPSTLAEYRAGRVVDPNDCITLCWTSGTEGRPKGVPRAHGDWLAIMHNTSDAPALDSDSVLLNLFPMVNAGGLGGMFFPWLHVGCRLVQHHPFDLGLFLRQIEDERVTHSVAPPALLTKLVQEPELMDSTDLSSLRTMGSGSTIMTPFMITGWENRGVEIFNMFGSNEGITLTGHRLNIPDPTLRGVVLPRPGDHGLPTRVKIDHQTEGILVDPLTGEVITEGEHPGELRLKGPAVFAGYWGNDAVSAFDENGYYKTGDLFQYEGDRLQFVRFVDRAKDLIVRGGFKIAPAEIESLVSSHPDVAEVAAVGSPDDVLGEIVCLYAVPLPGHTLTLESIVAHLEAEQVAKFKWPQRLVILDELPRSAIGKVLRRDLRTLAATS